MISSSTGAASALANAPRDGSVVTGVRTLVVVGVAVSIPAVAFIVAFPHRTDYVGHFLAGAGGTALLLGLLRVFVGQKPEVVVAATVASILAGVGTEATVFRIAIFDPVDLAIQSLGALLVASAVLRGRRSVALGAGLILLGLVLLWAGFRYAFA